MSTYLVIAGDPGTGTTMYILREGSEEKARSYIRDKAPFESEQELDERGCWYHPKQDDWYWVWEGPVEVVEVQA